MSTEPEGSRVISKQRVIERGEVLTGKREVDAMLDLVKQETERIESRFLVPACGTGQFLAEILERKLSVVRARYRKVSLEYERNVVLAVSSIYGIEIQEDNVQTCRSRMLEIVDRQHCQVFRKPLRSEVRRTIRFVLERNIIWGDALTLQTMDRPPKPIIFSEWSPVRGSMMKRRDFVYERMLDPLGFLESPLPSDTGGVAYITKPLADWSPTHFLDLPDANQSTDI